LTDIYKKIGSNEVPVNYIQKMVDQGRITIKLRSDIMLFVNPDKCEIEIAPDMAWIYLGEGVYEARDGGKQRDRPMFIPMSGIEYIS